MSTLLIGFLGAALASFGNTECASDAECYLNGRCAAGRCDCYAGWTGPHCGQFDFVPTPPTPLGGKAYPPEADSSTWGSSVIKGRDGMFHMYTSGILGKCGLAVWAPNCALTHATSSRLDGVYEARDVIMRGSNPQITEFNGELRLWHSLDGGPTGPSPAGHSRGHYCATCTNGSTPYTCRNESAAHAESELEATRAAESPPVSAHLIVSADPAGPWRNLNISCRGYGANGGSQCPTISNPTAFYFPNGTTLLQYDWQMPGVHTVGFFLARAPDVTGPYEPVSGDWHKTTITWPQDAEMRPACTDPFIWRDSRGAFHSVFHCRNWYAGSPSDAGGHAFSADGLHWTLAAEPAWNTTVLHTDGTNTTFFHRERPQVYIDPATGSPAALFNGVSLANQNQPFPWQKHCPPHPSHIQVGCDQSMAYVQRIRG